jgi:dihydropteroate synthase
LVSDTQVIDKPAVPPPVFHCGRFRLDLARPLIMGVVNVTPDSFSDGGQFQEPKNALAHAERLIEEGADLLDVGGESTRPGAKPVSLNEELDRVMPVLELLIHLQVPVSIDSRRPEVMKAAVDIGVDMLNDVNGFRDAAAFEVACQSNAGLCIMHMLGQPQTMQIQPHYQNVVLEVQDFLESQARAFISRGVNSGRIVLDPGFGFGKTLEHNLALMGRLSAWSERRNLLVGVSRKSMIAALLAKNPQDSPRPPAQRIDGSVAAALWAARQGARLLRVHDVQSTADALRIWSSLEQTVQD